MNKIILIIISALFLIMGCKNQSQNQIKLVSDKFNLGFENVENEMPINWHANGNEKYKFTLDSTIVKSGKYSAAIEFKDGMPQFGVWGLIIHENYDGKRITLSGYIKTEDVVGYASLLMRIDPEVGVDQVKINGTTEWKKYEVTVKMYPEKTTNFAIGAMLVGKGKVWFDDLKISIDGTDINELKTIKQDTLSVGKDDEFENSSNIIIDQLSNAQIENLSTLGLIWGFLKYYHPNIAEGNYNWDYELFRILPKILNLENNIQRDDIFVKWIDSLGEFSESKNDIVSNSEIKIKPDLDWISNSGFSNGLSSLLINVKNANRTGENNYVGYQLASNPDFKNEKPYSNMIYPDAEFRLLALYRYWNIIQYYFPYKYLIEEDWKNVLKEFIPKIVNIKNETEYTLTVLELIGRIQDSHAHISADNQILTDYFGKYYAPVELSFIENQPVVTGFLDDRLGRTIGLEIGDVLLKINSIPITNTVKNLLKYTPASNYPAQLRDIARNLLRTNDSVINVEFIRNNKIQNKTIKVYTDKELNVYSKYLVQDTCFKMINKEIAYISNGSLKREYLPEICGEIKNTKGLIIDNRSYPSDFPIYDLSNFLMPKSMPFIKFINGSITTPGLFIFRETANIGNKNDNYYKGKVIILVNENTQSAAETHTMAYRVHPNSLVIGSTTAGANGDLSLFYLPGGIYTGISGNGVYYPDGRETQRIGIVPDIEIKPTIQGIKEGRDEVLDKAIEVIK
jgi:hypothetical protein